MNHPRVTIITVVYNDAQALRASIASVMAQQYDNKEFVVVDGGSSDDTLQVLEEYADEFSCCVSEPDEGIYDAMNKALALATGEWVIFMNAGDCFYSEHVIAEIFALPISPDVAIVGGDIMAYSDVGLKMHLKAPGRVKSHRSVMPCSHQAAFIRRDVHSDHLYDYIAFPICADYACMCSILESGYKFQYVDIIVAWFNVNGVSSRKCFHALLESRNIPHVDKRSLISCVRVMLNEWKQIFFACMPEKVKRCWEERRLRKNGWVSISPADQLKLPLT